MTESVFKVGPLCCTGVGNALVFTSRVGTFVRRPGFSGIFGRRTLKGCLSFRFIPAGRAFFGKIFYMRPKRCFACRGKGVGVAHCFRPRFAKSYGGPFGRIISSMRHIVGSSIRGRGVDSMRITSCLSDNISSDCLACLKRISHAFAIKFSRKGCDRVRSTGRFTTDVGVGGSTGIVSPRRC